MLKIWGVDEDDVIEEVLTGIAEEGGKRRERCLEVTLERGVIDFVTKFGMSLPVDYVNFLRKSNGVVFEDAVICYLLDMQSKDENLNQLNPASELFTLNEHHRQKKLPKKYVILGFSDEGLLAFNAMENFYALLETESYRLLEKFEFFEEIFQEAIEGAL